MQVSISGLVEVSGFLQLEDDSLMELAEAIGLDSDASRQEVAKALVMEALRKGMDSIAQRVDDSTVEEHSFHIEEMP